MSFSSKRARALRRARLQTEEGRAEDATARLKDPDPLDVFPNWPFSSRRFNQILIDDAKTSRALQYFKTFELLPPPEEKSISRGFIAATILRKPDEGKSDA